MPCGDLASLAHRDEVEHGSVRSQAYTKPYMVMVWWRVWAVSS